MSNQDLMLISVLNLLEIAQKKLEKRVKNREVARE